MYLNLGAGSIPLLLPTRAPDHWSYAVWPALLVLLNDWNQAPFSEDCDLSGVLADYLQDHRSELLDGATGPTDPAERLDQLIEYLRIRFCPAR